MANVQAPEPSDQTESSERRAHPRVRLALPVRIDSRAGNCTAQMCALSEGGACVRADAQIGAVGELVDIEILLDSEHRCEAIAELVRVTTDGHGVVVGLRFSMMDQSSRQALRALLARLL